MPHAFLIQILVRYINDITNIIKTINIITILLNIIKNVFMGAPKPSFHTCNMGLKNSCFVSQE